VEAVGAKAFECEVDIRSPESVAAGFEAVGKHWHLPEVLINNAAGNFPVPAEDLSPNGWRAVVESVLGGTFLCSREFGRRHIAAARPGAILNIGASYAWTGGPGFAHSAAAKAGVKNLTETLAVEWAPYGIRVNGLVPGLFPHDDETANIRAVPGRGDRASEEASSPAGRTGRLRELGWAATFLASSYAAYITGHTLVVDGANWQRRALRQPDFTPIRQQLGKGPFTLE
jgi:NAD(P)-dependent dehydrogenase (short-subunit alcohol dehydrogenase family)